MDWLLALVLVIGAYYLLDLYFKHREHMAQYKRK